MKSHIGKRRKLKVGAGKSQDGEYAGKWSLHPQAPRQHTHSHGKPAKGTRKKTVRMQYRSKGSGMEHIIRHIFSNPVRPAPVKKKHSHPQPREKPRTPENTQAVSISFQGSAKLFSDNINRRAAVNQRHAKIAVEHRSRPRL